jgi:hypothetical protein
MAPLPDLPQDVQTYSAQGKELGKTGNGQDSEGSTCSGNQLAVQSAGSSNRVNNTINACNKEPPGCINPPNLNKTTVYLEYAVSTSILGKNSLRNIAPIQKEPSILLNTSSHLSLPNTIILLLKFKKLLPVTRRAFRVNNIPHNHVVVSKLEDVGCSIQIHS